MNLKSLAMIAPAIALFFFIPNAVQAQCSSYGFTQPTCSTINVTPSYVESAYPVLNYVSPSQPNQVVQTQPTYFPVQNYSPVVSRYSAPVIGNYVAPNSGNYSYTAYDASHTSVAPVNTYRPASQTQFNYFPAAPVRGGCANGQCGLRF